MFFFIQNKENAYAFFSKQYEQTISKLFRKNLFVMICLWFVNDTLPSNTHTLKQADKQENIPQCGACSLHSCSGWSAWPQARAYSLNTWHTTSPLGPDLQHSDKQWATTWAEPALEVGEHWTDRTHCCNWRDIRHLQENPMRQVAERLRFILRCLAGQGLKENMETQEGPSE